MEIRTFNFPIHRLSDEVNDELFWHVLEIWWTKAHCVNKRVCGADFPDGLKVGSLSDVEVEFLKKVGGIGADVELDENELKIRRLLPKDLKHFETIFEVLVKDSRNISAIFLPQSTASTSSNHTQLRSPHVNLPYAISLSKDSTGNGFLNLKLENRPNDEASVKWLSETLMPTLVRWMNHCTPEKPLTHSLRLLDLEAYNTCYNRLKAKYGKHLVEIWPEKTDPKKFVYEDIAVAAYLLTLWQEDREKGRCNRTQTFVDLGCGNGLLVYLLTCEQHTGYGIDIRRRHIWDFYDKSVNLIEQAFEPSDRHLFPDADWIIGNHSDELTPWIPVIAAKSSSTCNFFVIPCCAWDFNGKYQRKDANLSTYRSYLRYVRTVGEECGFHSQDDILKIPSTKRACIVGRRNHDIPKDVIEKNIRLLVSGRQSDIDATTDVLWTNSFPQREAKEAIRNCTTLPRLSIEEIVKKIAIALLNGKRYVQIPDGREWNVGGTLTMPECAHLLNSDELQLLKSQCGGLQTLLRNHHQIFAVQEGKVSIRNWHRISPEYRKNDKRSCWFDLNHPDGCPLSVSQCPFLHKNAEKV